jgi:aminomethyltransferase
MPNLKKTPLYSKHLALNAKMAPFAGWLMPISYSGIIAEHNAVRRAAGVFDVSHMGIIDITGEDALAFIQKIATNDASLLEVGQAQYSILCNESGGVIDDILIYRLPDRYRIVANASNTETVMNWLKKQSAAFDNFPPEADPPLAETIKLCPHLSMLSLQGPAAEEFLLKLIPEEELPQKKNRILGNICRTGYTGEDGFEFWLTENECVKLWDQLLSLGVAPCGLGARDTLRLEAALPLYGHEYNTETTPLEAGYGWAVKFSSPRQGRGKGDFIGRTTLLKLKEAGPQKKLVGIEMLEKIIPRQGYPILDAEGKLIGQVTSGTLSPTLGIPIALGYVKIGSFGVGTEVQVSVRGNNYKAKVVGLPFYKCQMPIWN